MFLFVLTPCPVSGDHYNQIKAHAYGYETKTESVLINAGQITTVSLDLRQTFASRLLSTFDESAFKYFQIGAGYAFAPNCPFGGNITAGWGPLELGFTIAGNISQKGFLTQDDGKFWRPKNYWSITPGVKLKYLGLGLGLGAINAKNLDDYSFPFTDNVGNSFTIDEKANPIFRNSIDSQNYFIMTPTAFGFIPLGDSPSDFYFGAGYAICPAIKSRGGFFFTIGLRFNSYNY